MQGGASGGSPAVPQRLRERALEVIDDVLPRCGVADHLPGLATEERDNFHRVVDTLLKDDTGAGALLLDVPGEPGRDALPRSLVERHPEQHVLDATSAVPVVGVLPTLHAMTPCRAHPNGSRPSSSHRGQRARPPDAGFGLATVLVVGISWDPHSGVGGRWALGWRERQQAGCREQRLRRGAVLEGIRRPVLALSAAVLALHVLLGAGAQATEAMPVRIPDSGLHELDSDVVCDDASSVRFPIRREGTVGPHMTQSFANRLAEYRYHDGEDWKTDESDDVYPVATGRIEYVGEISSTGKADGDVIVVHHTGRFVVRVSDAQGNPSGVKVVTEFWSAYLHVVPGSVAKGDCVTPGAPLGTTSPTSTNAYGEHPAHLHLSIRLVDCKTMGSDCSGAYRPSAKAVLDSGAIHPSDFIDANQGFAPVGTIPAGSSKPPGLPSRLPWADGERHALAPSSYVAEDPGGWGPQVVSTVQFPIDRGDLVYPMYGGTVVWAGCASGDAEYLGNTVVVRTTDPVGGSDYLAVYGHLGRIDVGLGDVSVNTPLGTFGATTRVNRDACEDVLGAPRLQFGLFKGGAMTTGGVSSGVPIAPEPLIGDGVYEKFTWWTGPARARDLRAFVGNPGGSWCDDAVECPAIGGASLWLDQILLQRARALPGAADGQCAHQAGELHRLLPGLGNWHRSSRVRPGPDLAHRRVVPPARRDR